MRKINKKGFTILEVLTVIVIITIIMLISFPFVNNLIDKNSTDLYHSYEKMMVEYAIAGDFEDYDIVPLEEIEGLNKTIKGCEGYVRVCHDEIINTFNYKAYIRCEGKYTTTNYGLNNDCPTSSSCPLTLSSTSGSVNVNDTISFNITSLCPNITVTSADSNIASVTYSDKMAVVTGISEGTTSINVLASGNAGGDKTATYQITVSNVSNDVTCSWVPNNNRLYNQTYCNGRPSNPTEGQSTYVIEKTFFSCTSTGFYKCGTASSPAINVTGTGGSTTLAKNDCIAKWGGNCPTNVAATGGCQEATCKTTYTCRQEIYTCS